jgi:hypothetical protein
MKNLFLTIFILLSLSTIANARECKSGHINGDAFIYSDGKKVKVIKGTKIPDPANKIIMIFNKGGWIVKEGQYSGECKNHIPKNLGKISGTKIKGKELVLMLNGRLHKAGGADGHKCGWKFKGAFHQPWYDCLLEDWGIPKRANVNKELINELVSNGTPRNQIFMSGISCGGIDTLRHKGLHPDDFNATIAFMPNCWDRKPNTPLRKMQIDELKSFKKIDALVFHSPVDGEGDWRSNSIWMKKDLGNIPGIQWIDTPGHTGKDIVVNGKKCGIKDKMKGGWEEAWPEGKEKLTSEKKFIKVDKKLYKEMKKKGAGHQLVSYSCFDYYHPEIIKFIESRI